MSFYGNNLRNDLTSLRELAELEAGGKNQHYERCFNEVGKEFPSGDSRLISHAQPHMECLIPKAYALKYWEIKHPKSAAPRELAEPSSTEGWQKLVAGLSADNDRLRSQIENANLAHVEIVDKLLTPSANSTFGAVCYLLAKFGQKDGENIFQTKGISDVHPIVNAISESIETLASDMSGADSPTRGFEQGSRRGAISEAIAAFTAQLNTNKANSKPKKRNK